MKVAYFIRINLPFERVNGQRVVKSAVFILGEKTDANSNCYHRCKKSPKSPSLTFFSFLGIRIELCFRILYVRVKYMQYNSLVAWEKLNYILQYTGVAVFHQPK